MKLARHLREGEALQSTGSRLQHALKDMSSALFSPSAGAAARTNGRRTTDGAVNASRSDAGREEEAATAPSDADVAAFSPRRRGPGEASRTVSSSRTVVERAGAASQARSRSAGQGGSGGLAGALLRSMHDSSDEEGGSTSGPASSAARSGLTASRSECAQRTQVVSVDLPISDLLAVLQKYLATLQSHHAEMVSRVANERKQCLRLARTLAELQTAQRHGEGAGSVPHERSLSRRGSNSVSFGLPAPDAAPTSRSGTTAGPAASSQTAEPPASADPQRSGLHPAVVAVDASFGSWPSARSSGVFGGTQTGGTGAGAGVGATGSVATSLLSAISQRGVSAMGAAYGANSVYAAPSSARGSLVSPFAEAAARYDRSEAAPSAAVSARRNSIASRTDMHGAARATAADAPSVALRPRGGASPVATRYSSQSGLAAAAPSRASLVASTVDDGGSSSSSSRVQQYISAVLQQWGLEGSDRSSQQASSMAADTHTRTSTISEAPSSVTSAASDAGSAILRRPPGSRETLLQVPAAMGSTGRSASDRVAGGPRAPIHVSSRAHVVTRAPQVAVQKQGRSPPGPGTSRGVAMLGRR
jgi:hypothetical protein